MPRNGGESRLDQKLVTAPEPEAEIGGQEQEQEQEKESALI